MAFKRKIVIETPAGAIIKTGKMSAKLEWNPHFAPNKRESFGKAQEFVDSEMIRLMAPETPRRTSVLIKSATLGTTIGSGEIKQIAPYARRQYYEHKSKSRWFEVAKNRHKKQILEGAKKYAAR